MKRLLALGATDTSRRPLSRASRPFIGWILKGNKGSRAVVRCEMDGVCAKADIPDGVGSSR
jgi:hypothetical protein